mgnify:FL=1|jgi:hypothetical protein
MELIRRNLSPTRTGLKSCLAMEIPLGLSSDQLLSEKIPVSPIWHSRRIMGAVWITAMLLEGQIFSALTTNLLIPNIGLGKQGNDARGFCSL